MNTLRGVLDIRRMDTVPNARIMELYGVRKGLDERMMKASYGGSAMWRGWGGIGSPRESI